MQRRLLAFAAVSAIAGTAVFAQSTSAPVLLRPEHYGPTATTVNADAPIYVMPDASRAPLRVAKKGSRVNVIEAFDADWWSIGFIDPEFGQRRGYVETQYLRKPVAPAGAAPEEIPPAPPGGRPTPADATAFMGTWNFVMENPPNSEQTIRVWDQNGVVTATLQIGSFPPNDITGVFKDGDVLVLTTTVRENGLPIWAVIALTLEGDTMTMAQMLPHSQTIKRGTAHRAAGL
jgi:hypothetical protein